ncbi:MAG: hypothetical protein II201_00060 [Clostridia bacterium]|nr:hypothetical protein [Clostridia bacterium]
MKWYTHLKGKRTISVFCAAAVLFVALFVAAAVPVSAENIDETNPEFTKIDINGSSELEVQGGGLYNCTGSLEQGDGKYTIRSNSFVVWSLEDDVTFAYRKYNVGFASSDFLEISATVNYRKSDSDGDLNFNSSTGILLRSGLQPNASNVFLHCREQEVMIVYRSQDGKQEAAVYSGISVTYPVQLKVSFSQNKAVCSFKTAEMSSFLTLKACAMKCNGPLYAGLAAHSVSKDIFIKTEFSDVKVNGIGTYNGGNSGSDPGGDSPSSEYVESDLPVDESKLLMRETFTDGDMTAGKNEGIHWVWDNPQYANIVNEFGNRYWLKDLTQDSADYIGDENWTDYKVSADIQFTENCDTNPDNAKNIFKLYARHKQIDFYGHSDYSAVLRNVIVNKKATTQLVLFKRVNAKADITENGMEIEAVDIDNYLEDGLWHNIAISVFDNVVKVYWDNQLKITYIDSGGQNQWFAKGDWEHVNSKGNIGIATYETSVKIDNIIVEKLEDTINGDYDNTVGGGWDDPVPGYLDSWSGKYKYY